MIDIFLQSLSEKDTFKSKIVGNFFKNDLEKLTYKNLVKGDELLLEHDENNTFDENAIDVIFKNTDATTNEVRHIKLGYIPKEHNLEIIDLVKEKGFLQAVYNEKGKITIKLV